MLLLILIIILIILFLINNEYTESFEDTEHPYSYSTDLIRTSKVGERGVVASKDYEEGDILELCPCIKQKTVTVAGKIEDYIFDYDEDHSLIAFGYCSMYNHIDDNNAEWEVLNENQIVIKAIKKIKKGEEIFINYGDAYWSSRKMKKNDLI
jgi:hypothetical protein